MLGRRRPSQIGEPAAPAVAHVRNPRIYFLFRCGDDSALSSEIAGNRPRSGIRCEERGGDSEKNHESKEGEGLARKASVGVVAERRRPRERAESDEAEDE